MYFCLHIENFFLQGAGEGDAGERERAETVLREVERAETRDVNGSGDRIGGKS